MADVLVRLIDLIYQLGDIDVGLAAGREALVERSLQLSVVAVALLKLLLERCNACLTCSKLRLRICKFVLSILIVGREYLILVLTVLEGFLARAASENYCGRQNWNQK